MRFRTLLIDDELLARQRLRRLLLCHSDSIRVIDDAESGQEAVEKIDSLKPDLIFLDIQMPEMDGFEVLQQIEHKPFIIFSTAYDEYALRAFETNSIDYLLKPVNPARLEKAIQKLITLTRDEIQDIRQDLNKLISQVSPARKRLQVRIGDKIRLLNLAEICFFRADNKYVAVNTREDSFLLTKTLQQLEQTLPPDDFVRIHRSAIVNLSHVTEIVRTFSGGYVVRIRDRHKTELPVSRKSRRKLGLI